ARSRGGQAPDEGLVGGVVVGERVGVGPEPRPALAEVAAGPRVEPVRPVLPHPRQRVHLQTGVLEPVVEVTRVRGQHPGGRRRPSSSFPAAATTRASTRSYTRSSASTLYPTDTTGSNRPAVRSKYPTSTPVSRLRGSYAYRQACDFVPAGAAASNWKTRFPSP